MSTLTMPLHNSHTGFHREFAWQEARPYESSHRPRNEPEKIALPSIRQAFPELQLRGQQDGTARTPSVTSPLAGTTGTMTPPEYVHSPRQSKRRRLSFEDDIEGERASQVPRLYASPTQMISRHPSSPSAPRSTQELWGQPERTSPYSSSGALPSIRSPAPMEVRERAEPRPTLPSLPRIDFERSGAQMQGMRSLSREDYIQEPVRSGVAHPGGPSMEAPAPAYRQASYGYGYHHPTRIQSLSLGSIHPFDRAQYSPSAYGPQFQDNFMRMGELNIGMNGDNKQRKRRGNLPKETTDKLRAWFVAHLQHPYPTEDEKQDLMQQTGLQMNQISNWFINARRRQLPTMINNARAEADAMTNRGGESKVLQSTERTDYDHHHGKRSSVPLADGEGCNYEDVDMDTLSHRRAVNLKRGSI